MLATIWLFRPVGVRFYVAPRVWLRLIPLASLGHSVSERCPRGGPLGDRFYRTLLGGALGTFYHLRFNTRHHLRPRPRPRHRIHPQPHPLPHRRLSFDEGILLPLDPLGPSLLVLPHAALTPFALCKPCTIESQLPPS